MKHNMAVNIKIRQFIKFIKYKTALALLLLLNLYTSKNFYIYIIT